MKAIDNFDLNQNVRFSTYAVPMIIGEIRRYLRDNNPIRVSRSLRDIAYKALQVRDGEPRHADRREERLVDRLLPLPVRRLEQARAPRQRHVVHEHVEGAERLDGPVDDGVRAVGAAHVCRDRQDPFVSSRQLGQLPPGIVQRGLRPATDGHEASFRDQGFRAREAQPPARTGDDRDPIGESKIHG